MARKKKVTQEELDSALSGIVHEIRNPLNALNINNQLLSEYAYLLPDWFEKKEEMQEIIGSNMRVLSRLNDLISEFLRFTRPRKPEFVVTDLNRIVEEVIRFVEVDFRGRGIKVKFYPGDGSYPVLVDEKMVKQALLNVLLNAAESLDKEVKIIKVTSGRKNNDYFVTVKDNGCGIGREERKKVFSVFYTTKSEGSGLGLPIVQKIMKAHHGNIRLRSRKDKGTEFTLGFIPENRFRKILSTRNSGVRLPEVIK
jgi:signal transduction histidine kinase